jgi:hypothetical protein
MSDERRDAIFILGAHGSGVELFARMMSAAGAATTLDGGLSPDGAHATTSHVSRVNSRILSELGVNPTNPLGARGARNLSPSGETWIPQAREAVRMDYGHARFIALGDPSLSLTADLWRQAVEDETIQVTYVIVVRHPLEVVATLKGPEADEPSLEVLNWSTYLLASELGARGRRRVFVSFEDLLTRTDLVFDRLERAMGVSLPMRPSEACADLIQQAQSLGAGKTSHQGDLDKLPRVGRFYNFLLSACREEPWNVDATRELGGWLDDLEDAFGAILDKTGRELALHDRRLAAERNAARLTRIALEDAHRAGRASQRIAEAARVEAAAAASFAQAASEQIAELAQAQEAAGAKTEAFEARAVAAESTLDLERQRRAAIELQLRNAHSTSAAMRVELTRTRVDTAELRHRLSDAAEVTEVARADLETARSELTALTLRLKESTEDAGAARADLAELTHLLMNVRDEADALSARCGVLESANRSLEALRVKAVSEHTAVVEQLERARERATAAEARALEAEAAVEAARRDEERAQERAADLEDRAQAAQQQATAAEARAREAEAATETARRDGDRERERAQAAQRQAMAAEAHAREAKAAVEAARRDGDRERERAQAAQRQAMAAEAHARESEAAVEAARRDSEHARVESERTSAQLAEMEQDHLAWLGEHRRTLETVAAERVEAREALAATNAELEQTRRELSAALGQSQSLARQLVEATSRPSGFWSRLGRSLAFGARG